METVVLENGKPNMDDFFVQKTVEVMVDMKTKKFVNDLNVMKEAVNKLNEEIQMLKQNKGSGAVIAPAAKEDIEVPEFGFKEIKSEVKPEVRAQRNEPVKQRYGDYKPGDIDINKFFYFGNKR